MLVATCTIVIPPFSSSLTAAVRIADSDFQQKPDCTNVELTHCDFIYKVILITLGGYSKTDLCKMPIENSTGNITKNLLRPVVRFALRRGVKFRTIVEELKALLVEEAQRELTRSNQDLTVSKLSVMTGLQRRDVQRISDPSAEASQHLDLLTRIIGMWTTNQRFSRGTKPKLLSFEGPNSDFAELVKLVSMDLNASTVLFELDRLGLVKRSGAELELLWNAYQISGDSDDAYTLLERDLSSLVEGVDGNITQSFPIPNLHISTHFDNVSPSEAHTIREWLLKKGAALHAEAREFIGSFDKDINPTRYADQGGMKVTLTSFSLCKQPEADDANN